MSLPSDGAAGSGGITGESVVSGVRAASSPGKFGGTSSIGNVSGSAGIKWINY